MLKKGAARMRDIEKLAKDLFQMAHDKDAVLALACFKDGEGIVVVNGTHDDLMHAVFAIIEYMRRHTATQREY